MFDALRNWSGEPMPIGFGEVPGVVVVDFQTGFTRDPEFLMDGAPLIDRAVENTARLLRVARAHGVPVASCYTAYRSEREMPYWKLAKMRETLLHGHPSTRLDPRIHDPDYDFVLCKEGASIFFQTPRRRVLRQGTGRHGRRYRLRHQRLHSGERDRQLSVQVSHHGAGGLRRRSRGGLPLEQPARRRSALLRRDELRRGDRLPRDPERQEQPVTPGATPSRTRGVSGSADADRETQSLESPGLR